jgi:O-antigen/teichoic acid export membrane protein
VTSTGRRKTSPRMILFVMVGTTSVLNYSFGLAMGWLLGPGDYGLLAFAQALLLVGGMVLHSGFSWSLARAVVKAEGPRERDALVRGTLLANLALAAAMGAVLILLFAAGPLRDGFERWSVVIVVALSLPFISLMATASKCAQGSERFGIVASLGLTEMSCKTVSGAALALAGLGAIGAISGFLVGAVCSAALGFRQLGRRIGVRLRGGVTLPDVRASAAMFGALLGLSLLLSLDLAGLKLLSEERALVGYYQAGLVLSNAPYYVVGAAILPVLFVQLSRHESLSEAGGTLGETLGLTCALILPFELALVVLPRDALLTFFPDVYAAGAPALRLLAIGNSLLILAAIFTVAFQAVGRAKIPVIILLPVTLAEPLALWAVVPSRGALGAAWVFIAVTSVALLCLVSCYLWGSSASSLRRVLPWVLRFGLAVGVGLAAGRLALGAGAAAAVVTGAACYLVAATALRIIDPLGMLPGKVTSLRKLAFQREE